MNYIEQLGKNTQKASKMLISLGSVEKNNLLCQVATALVEQAEMILAGNTRDLAAAEENGISGIILDRLRLNHECIKGIAEGAGQVADLQDPVGQAVRGYTNLDGLKIVQKRVPLGVVAMISESRPNVSADAFSLAFKTGNAIISRGGRDAIHSNTILIAVIRQTLVQAGIDADVVRLVEDTSHAAAEELVQAVDYIDVLIPRGGARLARTVKEKSKVPVIETEVDNCHIYVDDSADLEMAVNVVVNTKTQRPSVCNATESLVVHGKIAEAFLPKLEEAVTKVHPVEFRADQEALRMLESAVLVTEEDYSIELLGYIMSVEVVKSVEEAVDWINGHTTHHSEAIVTQSTAHAEFFQGSIDAAAVYINASIRFTDDFVFGLGTEIGISTQRVYARGPMGLEALTSTKFYINGRGQIRR